MGELVLRRAAVFVPKYNVASEENLVRLQQFIDRSRKLLVVTGAGVSTESGIPDYRSADVGLYATSSSRPMIYSDFLGSAERRQRYWARNYIGHSRFSSVKPNFTHRFFADFEKTDRLLWLITQNVDNLHISAGSQRVTELHGNAHRVVCLECKTATSRRELQAQMLNLNPNFVADVKGIAPDGDAFINEDAVKTFLVPSCVHCGGILKPDVIFFGDNVAKRVVEFLYRKTDECDAVLVAGSSLEVYSSYRFISRANKQGKPLAIVNIGKTRADDVANLKVESHCSEVFRTIRIV
ncbi:NAD-dependent protein lipoamidase sirtuin-4, mitochondrial-like [Corticium candelabrum]|uniref:NAD-dependent protein lipoamidase sirtuin-4, mitochondrial-like n=1 Tax=Corticium candelabrum TaxID=121492 RepID=UPI002E2552FE|nr:NAD-dependent protein lipoamidase sirtuin-4, mitochondrial-like [Corticium candelabrum]